MLSGAGVGHETDASERCMAAAACAASVVEESQLFIEACHACETRLTALQAIGAGGDDALSAEA